MEAAKALCDLLTEQSSDRWGALEPEPVAAALQAALQRHSMDKVVQRNGCLALYRLCRCFRALRTALRRDAFVYASVRAAAEVARDLEEGDDCDWYTRELCGWLQPCLICGGGRVGRPVVQTAKSQGCHLTTGHMSN